MRTYGSIAMDGGFWLVEAEPHVLIRLKRIFARALATARTIKMRHAPDVAHDLLWVLERYPMKMSPDDASFMYAQSKSHVERSERFVRVLSGEAAARTFEMAIPPRDYQRIAADLLLQQGGLLIADDMGVGKTVSAICAITEPATRPALVVTMTALTHQWEREIARFAPSLTTHVIKKGTPYALPESDVLIMNYSKLAGWAPALVGKVPMVVFDECQELRRNESAKATAAREVALSARFRCGLSGTPIYNYGNEFFNVIDVLRPGELGTSAEFNREWGGSTDSQGNTIIKDPRAFGTYVREQGLMIRRTRKDVGRELPGLSIVPHVVESDDVFEALGDDATELARFILDRDGKAFDQMKARGELDWKMRQATGIAKAKYVAKFVELLLESGEPRVLLFGWHHVVYDIWEEVLSRFGVVRFTGEESLPAKEKARTAFTEGGARVMMMSLRSGAGIDGLQKTCRTVVFGELDWSPAVHAQCTDRINRDGQPDPVVAYYLLSDEGSDPVIQSVLGVKKAQLEGVRNPDDAIFETVKADGVVELARAVLARSRKE